MTCSGIAILVASFRMSRFEIVPTWRGFLSRRRRDPAGAQARGRATPLLDAGRIRARLRTARRRLTLKTFCLYHSWA